MPQAIVDPDEIERFTRVLKKFNSELIENSRRVNGQFKRLGDTWRDQEHRKFAQEFERTLRQIEQFVRVSEEQIPYLERKVRKAREYLGQR